MGINFSAFEIGRRALRAQQLGITVTGQNIANVNTPGYARQRLLLAPAPPDGARPLSIGVGVLVQGVEAARDRFIEARLQRETGIAGRLNAERDVFAVIEGAFGNVSEGGIGQALTSFFNSFRDLEANPTSVPLRTSVVARAVDLTNAFHLTRSRLQSVYRDTQVEAGSLVEEVNRLAAQVAELNRQISVAAKTGNISSALEDQRGEVVKRLTELVGVNAVENPNGDVTLTFSDGRALVLNDRAFAMNMVSVANGVPIITLDGQPLSVDGGRIGGLLNALSAVGDHIVALDGLAAAVAARVNQLHTSGEDLDGNAGAAFFVSSNGGPIDAATLSVNPALTASPRRVVAAATGAGSGDATVARAIANLVSDSNQTVGARSGSFPSIFSSIVADAGDQLRVAEDGLAAQQSIVAQVVAQRESVSGVSLDEEAINLMQYQRAYEAAARFLKVADEMTQTLIALGQ
ncbi:MAG: flagellar hook-associated protein FlgK [Pyrinomonas sp.]|mgnify:CR=1 FL=1|uniref:flagellar hook-associated protein FlgK n=1 Tax=Pyrinomonas sp. TaxID=2080306 RepID=UPI00332EA6C8